jgi:hypothetical protein
MISQIILEYRQLAGRNKLIKKEVKKLRPTRENS